MIWIHNMWAATGEMYSVKRKYKKRLPFETKNTQKKEYWRLVLLSLFIYNNAVCEAAYAP